MNNTTCVIQNPFQQGNTRGGASQNHVKQSVPYDIMFNIKSPSDPCLTDLDKILREGQDPGAQQYLVLPIKGKKPGVLGAHAFFVLGTVPIKSKDPGAQQYLVLGTVPIKGKNWGFGCPCIFCTRYRAHHVKTSPAGSCSIFPQSTWAPCPKRWDFLCIQVTGCH